ncbi:MAG: hypothetical protein QOK03_1754 [Candidatus Binataceae bacterium]|nr:hypothetical protein [Candidatus Binataceae bacterium]
MRIADGSVAPRHAVISRRRGRWLVSDAKSATGTFVNEKQVRRRRRLKHRDAIRFGTGNVYRFIDPDASLRRHHRRITLGLLWLAIGVGGWLGHFKKWDNGLPSAAELADFVAVEQAGFTSRDIAEARRVGSAVAPKRIAAAAPITTKPTAAAGTASAVVSTVTHPAASRTSSTSASAASSWLDRLNYYRAMAGLGTLRDDRQLSANLIAHAHYVLDNYTAAIRSGDSLGAATHGEDPGKAGYTSTGSSAAENSQFAWGYGSLDRQAQIDQWIAGPFHRFEMLDPFITQAGFGEASANGCWVAALRLPPPPEEVKAYPHAIEFPPDGAAVSLEWNGIETPDPLTSCSGYKFPAGLPITLQLGRLQRTELWASRLTENGKPIEHCAFDSHSYRNPNGDAQEYGRWALRSAGAVVLIPREPLTRGAEYSVSVTAHGRTYAWTFKIAAGH